MSGTKAAQTVKANDVRHMDILRRVRFYAQEMTGGAPLTAEIFELAADEIERLRVEAAELERKLDCYDETWRDR